VTLDTLDRAGSGARTAQVASQRFVSWICQKALPLWANRSGPGGLPFAERLDWAGQPESDGFVRLRVTARQVIVFAQAARLGMAWTYPVAQEGWAALRSFYWNRNWGWRSRCAPGGSLCTDPLDFYDQAFALYACVCWAELSHAPDAIAIAHRTLDLIDERLRRPTDAPGWSTTAATRGHDQNAHMHYLEALLAFQRFTPLPEIAERIELVLSIAGHHLLDPQSQAILEWFDHDWRPLPRATIEPGHQYEWGWLLAQAEELGFCHEVPVKALYAFADQRGWERRHKLIFDACARDGAPQRASHRLWPHCEAIRAATVRNDKAAMREWANAISERLLGSFLAGPIDGGWIDRFDASLRPCVTTIPGSSLYHLWEAGAALVRAGWARWPDAAVC